jgi:hypothetical protein
MQGVLIRLSVTFLGFVEVGNFEKLYPDLFDWRNTPHRVFDIIDSSWSCLAAAQKALVLGDLMPQLLRVMMEKDSVIQSRSFELYFKMFKEEIDSTNSFAQIETHTISALDTQGDVASGKIEIDGEFIQNFEEELKKKLGQLPQAEMLSGFIQGMKRFFDLAHTIRALPESPEYEEDRTIATLKLLEYLNKSQRKETYVKYVHLLAEQHEKNGHFVEAAMTLMLHLETVDYSSDMLPAVVDLPQATGFDRRVIARFCFCFFFFFSFFFSLNKRRLH